MTKHAEELAELVAQLVDDVREVATVTRYKTVKRGGGRTRTVVEHPKHHTRSPGLLHQLHAIQSAAGTVPVKIYRWDSDHKAGEPKTCGDVCAHGRWIHLRTEQRPAGRLGAVTAGAAVPSGSPGWDETGAANVMRSGGFESASPATSATDLLLTIQDGTAELRAHLRAAADRTRGAKVRTSTALRELVGLALEVDTDTAVDAVWAVRGWVSAARVLLAYDAPVLVLRDLYCRECRGALHARADASTAVWCVGRPRTAVLGPAGRVTVEGPALEGAEWPVRLADPWGPVVYPAYDSCGETYGRGAWVGLLAQAAKERRSTQP